MSKRKPAQFKRFSDAMSKIVRVSKEELFRREEQARQQRESGQSTPAAATSQDSLLAACCQRNRSIHGIRFGHGDVGRRPAVWRARTTEYAGRLAPSHNERPAPRMAREETVTTSSVGDN